MQEVRVEGKIVLRPTLDQVIVELLEPGEKKTDGGLILPEIATRGPAVKTEQAVVVAVGPGRMTRRGFLRQPEVNRADRVIIRRAMGTELKVGNGRRLVICKPEDILAVVR